MTRKRFILVAMALLAIIGTAIAAPPITNYSNVGNWVYGVYSNTAGTLKLYKTSAIAVTIDGSAATANRTITLPDGAVTLSTGTMVATSGATFTGTVKLNDSVNFVLGTGNDLTAVHNGTDTSFTSAVGDLIFDNTDTNDQMIFRAGTDTSATGFEFRNNSDSPILNITADGAVGETAMSSIDLSPSGAMALRGGGASTFGDDTGYWSFDGAGAVSEAGMTTFSVTPSSTLDLDAGGAVSIDSSAAAISIGGDAVAQALNVGTGGARTITVGNTAASVAVASRMTTTDGVSGGTARVVGGRAYSAVAASSAITGATETEANFDSNYTIPADTLKAGTVISYDFQGIHTATTGNETHDILVKLGGTTIASKSTIDPADNDIFAGHCTITIRTAGAGGTMVALCSMGFGASGSTSPQHYYLASTAVNTTVTNVAAIAIDRQGAATDGDSARLDIMNVRVE